MPPVATQENTETCTSYGGKAALCFESDDARRGESTIAIDAAAAVGVCNYDWSGKIRAQLTRGELPAVAAVLPGYLHRCEYRNHGPDKSKGFSFENQGARVFAGMGKSGRTGRAPGSTGYLRQLCKERP
jgi:hypothetical protein